MSLLGKVSDLLWKSRFKEVTSFREGDSATWLHLEKVAVTLVEGYNLAMEESKLEVLVPRLNAIEDEFRGFAYEGAAIGLTAIDFVQPWQKRFQAFVEGPGAAHTYVAYIGVGLAMARLHMNPERVLPRLNSLLGWSALDGYGFHEGIFARRRYVEETKAPLHLSRYGRRVFDQGLGRSLWFLEGADAGRIAAKIAAFPAARQADLWSGVGVACTYAGGVDRTAIEAVREAAGPYSTWLAQGATIAALGRHEGNIPAAYTDLACEVLCGLSSDMAAYVADTARQNLPPDGIEPAHKIWRQRIEAQFASPPVPAVGTSFSASAPAPAVVGTGVGTQLIASAVPASSPVGKLRKLLFGAALESVASFRHGNSMAWQRVEAVALTVAEGYNIALEETNFDVLAARLNTYDEEIRGFAYEGAGMGLMLLDCVLPWKQRLPAFVAGPGAPYIYLAYVGAGLGIARTHIPPERVLARVDPLLVGLALDGYGFHLGFFSPRPYIRERKIPTHLSHYGRHAFDQGVGRGIWFIEGANVERVAATIATFPPARQADLWSGIGLAGAFTGGIDRAEMESIRVAAGPYSTRLAHGATIAALARSVPGNLAAHTDLACEVWCGLSSGQAAHIADVARQNFPPNGAEPAYEIWRQRIEAQFMVPTRLIAPRVPVVGARLIAPAPAPTAPAVVGTSFSASAPALTAVVAEKK